jgi:hypothetical protein
MRPMRNKREPQVAMLGLEDAVALKPPPLAWMRNVTTAIRISHVSQRRGRTFRKVRTRTVRPDKHLPDLRWGKVPFEEL